MKASEMIIILQSLIAKHGDKIVESREYHGYFTEVEEVDLNESGDGPDSFLIEAKNFYDR